MNHFSVTQPIVSSHPAASKESAQFSPKFPVLKVIGMGGGGCNAVNRMVELGLQGVQFINCNTDHQALLSSKADINIQIGPVLTRGLGAGGKPKVGREAAIESREQIARALKGADMVFLTAGMGGGTGTGSIPVAAAIARQLNAVTIAVVTTPFGFESGGRTKNANEGIRVLQSHTDTLITIPNDRLLGMPENKKLPLDLAFRVADDVLRQAVQGITELITTPGLINVDFAHIKRHMKQGGGSYMAMGFGQGEDRAQKAINQALNHPLLDAIPIEQATGLIVNFTGSDLTLYEVNSTMQTLHSRLNQKVDVVFGISQDSRLKGKAQVILVVTGLGATPVEEPLPARPLAAHVSTEISQPVLLPSAQAQEQQPTRLPDLPEPELFEELFPSTAQVSGGRLYLFGKESAAQTQAPSALEKKSHVSTGRTDPLDIPAFMRRGRYTGK